MKIQGECIQEEDIFKGSKTAEEKRKMKIEKGPSGLVIKRSLLPLERAGSVGR